MSNFIEHLPLLTVVISLLSAITILIAGWIYKKIAWWISLVTHLSQFTFSLWILNHVLTHGPIHYRLGGWVPPWGIEYVMDPLNSYILVILLFLALFCLLYSKRNIEHELPKKVVSFYTVYQLLLTGLCGIVVTGDIFNMYVFIEIASLSAYALIASRGKIALRASFTYLVLGSIGACFFLLGIGFLYAVTGSLNMHDLSLLLPPFYKNRVVIAAFVFILVGLSIKMALFPLHTWLPDAHAFAPSEISAMLSGIIIEVATYAFIRVSFSVFTTQFLQLFPIFEILSWIAAGGIIFGSILAMTQMNLKRMLAYSSVANMGYIMLGVGLSTSTRLGLIPPLIHILSHALTKACMFLVAGAFIYKADLWYIKDLQGLGRKMPYSCMGFLLSALALLGLPPGVGFVTKWYLIIAALESKKYIFVGVIFLSTLLMVFYFWKVIEYIYIRIGEEGAKEIRIDEIPWSMLIPVMVLGSLCFIVGIVWLTEIPLPILDRVNSLFKLGRVP